MHCSNLLINNRKLITIPISSKVKGNDMFEYKHSLRLISSFIGLIFIATGIYIVIDGLSDNIHRGDVAVVLGSKVNSDGLPSPRLMARLNKSIQLYKDKMTRHIIVSGGTGKEGFDESEVMKEYLITHGIPKSAIITDSQGANTQSTAQQSALLMKKYGFKSALIVSQYFHLSRTRMAFKQCGISQVYTAHAPYFEWRDVYSTAREVVGFYYYLLSNSKCSASNTNQIALVD